jgi:hypothetical protein
VTVTASASADEGVAGVQFMLDGAPLGTEDTLAPYTVAWDTRTVVDGTYQLAAHLRDATGRVVASPLVTVTVSNAPATMRTRVEESDPAITYTDGWTLDNTSRPWSGGAAGYSSAPGARATFTFTGTSVSWIGFRGPQTGIARVLLDGAFVAEVDTFSPTEGVQTVLFTATGLAQASHTLTIEVTGLTNAASTDPFIVVDAFDVTSRSPLGSGVRRGDALASRLERPHLLLASVRVGDLPRAHKGGKRW